MGGGFYAGGRRGVKEWRIAASKGVTGPVSCPHAPWCDSPPPGPAGRFGAGPDRPSGDTVDRRREFQVQDRQRLPVGGRDDHLERCLQGRLRRRSGRGPVVQGEEGDPEEIRRRDERRLHERQGRVHPVEWRHARRHVQGRQHERRRQGRLVQQEQIRRRVARRLSARHRAPTPGRAASAIPASGRTASRTATGISGFPTAIAMSAR